MGFYIFWGFNALMALVFIFVMSFTLERGASHKKPWKEIFKTLFKRLGIVAIVYIVLLYIIGAIFMKSYNKECSPNKEDIAIMKPMAEKIADYIVANGIPKSLEDIPDLPYEVEGCENNYKCYFIKENKYKVTFGSPINNTVYELNIYSEVGNTGIDYFFMRKDERIIFHNMHGFGNLKNPNIYSNNTIGICNPMRM